MDELLIEKVCEHQIFLLTFGSTYEIVLDRFIIHELDEENHSIVPSFFLFTSYTQLDRLIFYVVNLKRQKQLHLSVSLPSQINYLFKITFHLKLYLEKKTICSYTNQHDY